MTWRPKKISEENLIVSFEDNIVHLTCENDIKDNEMNEIKAKYPDLKFKHIKDKVTKLTKSFYLYPREW